MSQGQDNTKDSNHAKRVSHTFTYNLENWIIAPDVEPSEKELLQLTREGKLTLITKQDLLSEASSAAIFNQKDGEGHDLRIYVKMIITWGQ